MNIFFKIFIIEIYAYNIIIYINILKEENININKKIIKFELLCLFLGFPQAFSIFLASYVNASYY